MHSNSDQLRVKDAALAALAGGPLTFDALLDRLLDGPTGEILDTAADAAGMDPADYLDEALTNLGGIWRAADRIHSLDHLMEGVVLTHRVTERELAAGFLDITPDLTVVDVGAEGELTTDAGPVTVLLPSDDARADQHGSLAGPPGWLDPYAAGDLLAITRRSKGLAVERVADVGDGAAEASALAAAFEEASMAPTEGTELYPLLLDTLTSGPDIFRRPVPALADLLASVGLEHRDGWIGEAGEDWEPSAVVRRRERRELRANRWRFDDCCHAAFDAVEDAWMAYLTRQPITTADVARDLAHGAVAEAFAEDITADNRSGSPALAEFATVIIEGTGRAAAPAYFLRALNADHSGDALAAEADLDTTLRLDPDYLPPYEAMADYAIDRGDGRRALHLLRQAGAPPDYPPLLYIASFFERYPDAGRNDPCPCGSGRKFKTCCQRQPRLSAADRIQWLVYKLNRFAHKGQRSAVIGLASSAVPDDFEMENLVALSRDPFIADLATFESGAVEDYLEERGPLLPAEERDLLELWSLAELHLWEIVEATEDTITMRDTKTGDLVESRFGPNQPGARAGEYVLARVVPGFGGNWVVGQPLPISLRYRDAMIEMLDASPEADDFSMFYGWMLAPPEISNREGERMMACTARLRPGDGDWERLAADLDTAYERVDDGRWHEAHLLESGDSVIRAMLWREGDELVVEANSENRLDRVLGTLIAERLVADERQEISMRRPGEIVEAEDVPDDDWASSPEAMEMLAEQVEEMEDRWLDESIPLLDGATPREAADDPTRRADLLALLRQLRGPSSLPKYAMGFDPDRIRRKLGLD